MAGPDAYYTCSMDPQVIENKAGNCPICHMKLIKVNKNNLGQGQIKLSKQQIKLANITFDTLQRHVLDKEITLTARVSSDKNLSEAISSTAKGRIDKLLIKNTSEYIYKGQLIYSIYSEELIAAQQEYLIAIQKENNSASDKNLSMRFIESAKNKLLLYGLNENQINQIAKSNQLLQTIPFYSKKEGFVDEINVAEGNYVSEGTTLFKLNLLNSLWIEAQVYLPYLPYFKLGTESKFTIPTASNRIYSGKVIFIDPQVQSPERFVLARFKIDNPDLEIKPGMLVNIKLKTQKIRTFAISTESVIQDSRGPSVWIYLNDGVFENKMVKVGMQNDRMIEIQGGLEENDIVVISGAYLLNSEYIFKRGANPMQSHQDMPGMKM
jgi:Cu(I)/Ag(I) efflux system membrane fusion protein